MLTHLNKNTYAPKILVYILLILSLSYITQQQKVLPAPLSPSSIKTCSFGQFRTANNQCMQCLVTCPKCKDYVSKCPGCAQDQKLNSNNVCQPCGVGMMNCNNPTNLVGRNGITCQPLYHEINNVCKPNCQVENCLECISIFAKTCKVCATGYALANENTFCKQASRRMLQTSTTSISTPSPPPSSPPTPSTATTTSSSTNTSTNTFELPQIKSTNDILKSQNITVDQNVKVNVDNIVPTTNNNLNTGFNNIITNITAKNPGVNNFLNQVLVNTGVMSTPTSTPASTTTTTAATNTNTNTVNGAINSFSINPTNFTTGFGDIPNFSTDSFTSFNSNTLPPFPSTSSTSASANASNNTGFGVFTTQPITTISSTTNSSVFNINNTSTPATTTTTTSTTRTTSTTIPTNIAQPINIINPTTNSTTITTPTLTTISTTPLPINTTTIINNPTSTKTTTNTTSTTTITLPNSTLPINLPTSTIPIATPTSTVPTAPISILPFITPSKIPLSINSCSVGYYYNATIPECSPCNPICATCINTDSQCLECANGWKKFGWKCIRNQTIAFRLGFQIPTTLKQAPISTNTSNVTFEQQLTNHLKSFKDDLFTNILPSEYRNQSLSPLSITGLSLDNLKKYLTLEMLLDKVGGANLQNIKKTMIQKLQTKTSLGSLLLKSFNLGQQTATGQIQYNNNNYYSNNTNENKPNLLAIILPAVLGGILCFCCIPLLLCYCCKKCCFKQEQSKQNFQTYQYAGPTSTQRRHTTIQPNIGSGQTVTYLPTNNNPPSINWQSGQTVNYKSGTNIELQKIGNNNRYIQQQIGSDDILDSDAAANKNKPQYNSNGFSDQVVDYANDKYNQNVPKRGIY